ncbi:hypothetical protein CBR_g54194 [Chara braunii]|uniref:TAP42-like protein n=1 Tax=Chara braunii TaxID=69332 RepID=A0A388K7H5_CHABU|nr:hypothetical protein CBR_g54194 [Chara braunii]|eukprot:GBG65903.1 hypothetical protein CBR_g54194 [Chara braunii]
MDQACNTPDDGVPLRVLFESGERIHTQADSLLLGPGSKGEGELKRGCETLLKCLRLVEVLGLFSPNEDKDDIVTGDIRYLLVPYYLADLMQRRVDGDRKEHVRLSRLHLSAFVRSCDRLGLLPEGDREAISREKPADLQTRRTEKIARFKRQRAAEAKLQELAGLRERRLRSSQAGAQGPAEGGDDNSTLAEEECDDEERELWFLKIGLALAKALDLLDSLQREEELLTASRDDGGNLREEYQKAVMDERLAKAERQHREMAASAAAGRGGDRRHVSLIGRDAIEGRRSGGGGGASVGPLSSRLGHAQHLSQHRCPHQIFGPASLMGKTAAGERDRLVSQVFQPSHLLPKYSIEQAGLMEMRMMERWQADQRAAMEDAAAKGDKKAQKALRGNTEGSDDDEDDDDDDAVMKARAWDDWKDEHRRGEGNSRLTPCG